MIAGEHEFDGLVDCRRPGGVGRTEVEPYTLRPQELVADHAEELFWQVVPLSIR